MRIRLDHEKQEVGQSVKSRALLSREATLEIYWSVPWKENWHRPEEGHRISVNESTIPIENKQENR
mgnify:CR=1 FL=1